MFAWLLTELAGKRFGLFLFAFRRPERSWEFTIEPWTRLHLVLVEELRDELELVLVEELDEVAVTMQAKLGLFARSFCKSGAYVFICDKES